MTEYSRQTSFLDDGIHTPLQHTTPSCATTPSLHSVT